MIKRTLELLAGRLIFFFGGIGVFFGFLGLKGPNFWAALFVLLIGSAIAFAGLKIIRK